VTDHLEELQRKCLKHDRKPLSKSQLEEIKATESEKVEKVKKEEDEDMEEAEDLVKEEEKEKEREKEKEKVVKKESNQRPNDRRDWKQNGRLSVFSL
jgi:hypothetical protein